MGGNALSKTATRRYGTKEYFALTGKVLSAVRKILPDARVNDVKAYGDKESFGDLDVLIEKVPDAKHRLETELLRLGVTEIVKNSDVWSVGWGDFQVDFIFQASKHYDFSQGYFAYNDLGNLIGRISRKLGFKFGHDGLWYTKRNESKNVIAELLVTSDFDSALEFLGYCPARYASGFPTLTSVFEYASSSRYFDPDYFDLSKRNHNSRVRDAKRQSYMQFLQWCSNRDFSPSSEITKEQALTEAMQKYPAFARELQIAEERYALSISIKAKFNGDLISSITSLTGKELGAFMAHLRKSADTSPFIDLDALILAKSPEELRAWLIAEFRETHNAKKPQ